MGLSFPMIFWCGKCLCFKAGSHICQLEKMGGKERDPNQKFQPSDDKTSIEQNLASQKAEKRAKCHKSQVAAKSLIITIHMRAERQWVNCGGEGGNTGTTTGNWEETLFGEEQLGEERTIAWQISREEVTERIKCNLQLGLETLKEMFSTRD